MWRVPEGRAVAGTRGRAGARALLSSSLGSNPALCRRASCPHALSLGFPGTRAYAEQ